MKKLNMFLALVLAFCAQVASAVTNTITAPTDYVSVASDWGPYLAGIVIAAIAVGGVVFATVWGWSVFKRIAGSKR